MDAYDRAFMVMFALAMFVGGTLAGRFGRVGTWRAGIVLGLTVAGASIVVMWRSFRK